MNKFSKTILIISVAFLGIGLFCTPSTQAVGNPLTVEFEQDPLFSNTDIKPGDSITRWAKVTNNYEETKPVAAEAINYPNPVPSDDLSRALDIIIKKGTSELYNNSLYNFYLNGETYLSDIGSGETTQYDFTISFPIEKGNEWQGKTTGFDILIGFQGDGGDDGNGDDGNGDDDGGNGGNGGNGGTTGGGGGGTLPPGLIILEESIFTTCTANCEAVVEWTTNYNATTQVVYGTESEDHYFNPNILPYYGYAHSEPDPEDLTKVKNHTVTLTNLNPNTTYCFRAVSHASPATISLQHKFTTGDCSELYPPEPGEPGEPSEPGEPGEVEGPGEIVIGPTRPTEPGEPGEPGEIEEEGEEEEEEEEEEEVIEEPEEKEESVWMNFLASLKDIFNGLMKCYSCLPWWLILAFILYPAIRVLAIDKEKKKEFPAIPRKLLQQQEMAWIGCILFLAGLALYFYQTGRLCVDIWVFLVLSLTILVIDYLLLKKEKRNMPLFSKQNFKFLLGVAIVIILFIIWYFITCIPLWVIAFLIVIYFIASDLFKRKMK